MAEQCGYGMAWIGPCQKTATENHRCSEHAKAVCCSCGAPATHQCDETGQFVCGFDLCDDCEHSIFPDGTNGGVGFDQLACPEGLKRHVRKTEQRFKPWYARGENDGS